MERHKIGLLEPSTRGIAFSLVRLLTKQSTCSDGALNIKGETYA